MTKCYASCPHDRILPIGAALYTTCATAMKILQANRKLRRAGHSPEAWAPLCDLGPMRSGLGRE